MRIFVKITETFERWWQDKAISPHSHSLASMNQAFRVGSPLVVRSAFSLLTYLMLGGVFLALYGRVSPGFFTL